MSAALGSLLIRVSLYKYQRNDMSVLASFRNPKFASPSTMKIYSHLLQVLQPLQSMHKLSALYCYEACNYWVQGLIFGCFNCPLIYETWSNNSWPLKSNNWDTCMKSSFASKLTLKHSWENGASNSLPDKATYRWQLAQILGDVTSFSQHSLFSYSLGYIEMPKIMGYWSTHLSMALFGYYNCMTMLIQKM